MFVSDYSPQRHGGHGEYTAKKTKIGHYPPLVLVWGTRILHVIHERAASVKYSAVPTRLPWLFSRLSRASGLGGASFFVQLFALRSPHRFQSTVIHNATLVQNLDQALDQRMICVSSLRLAKQKFEAVLESLGQASQRVLEHRQSLEQMLFVRCCFGGLDAGGGWLHDKHQTGPAAEAELLAKRISRPALLTKMRNGSLLHSQKK